MTASQAAAQLIDIIEDKKQTGEENLGMYSRPAGLPLGIRGDNAICLFSI